MAIPAIRFRALERPRLIPVGPEGDLPPLTLIFAPAGMGKTVLAAQWARGGAFGAREVLWMRSPETGSGASAFWAALLDALNPADERSTGRRAGAKRAVQRAVSRLGAPTVLVIDDYQNSTEASLDLEVAELLGLSEHLYIVALSRRFAALDGPLVTSRTPFEMIDADRLAFTREETAAVAELYGAGGPRAVDALHESSGGWPVAVRLVVQQLAEGGEQRDFDSQLARFVVQHSQRIVHPRGRSVLLLAALCELVSVDLVSEVLELGYAETLEVVRELCELGLLSRNWYSDTIRLVGHPGFASTLRSRALQEFGDPCARELQRRSARELARDAPFSAVRQLIELGAFEDASRAIARDFLEVVDSHTGLLALLRRLPLDEIQGFAVLVGSRLILEMSEPETPGDQLDALHGLLRSSAREALRSSDSELRIVSLALLVAAERMRGNGGESLRLARDLEQRLFDESERTTKLLERSLSILHAISALTGVLAGDLALGRRSFSWALASAEQQGNEGEQIRGWYGLSIVAALRGDIAQVHEHIARAEEIEARAGLRSPHLSWVNGVAARAFADIEAARMAPLRDRLSELGPLISRVEQWPILAIAEATAAREQEGCRAALDLIGRRSREAEAAFRATAFFKGVLAIHAANLNAVLGDYASAAQLLAELPEALPDAVAAQARLKLLTGDREGAIRVARALLRAESTPRLAAEAGLLLAAALEQRGDAEGADSAFATAIELMRDHGLTSPLTMAPYDALLALAERASGRPWGAELIAHLEELPETLRCVQYEALSRAELRTLGAFGRGASTVAEAAEVLFVTQNTVKFHLRSVFRKLRVSQRDEAVQRARSMGLIDRAGEA